MRRPLSILLSVALTLCGLAPVARAEVNIQRQGAENPILEVAKSTVYGALGGLAIGGAIALVSDENDNDGDIFRWCFVGGTFLGLGYGIYQVSSRPKATAVIELRGGSPSLHAVLPAPEPGRGMTMRLIAVRF
mgnify:CR=1 FL=1